MFRKYPSIINSYREKDIEFMLENNYFNTETEFFVTEKIHGSNLSIHFDGTEFKFSKRNNFVQEKENFYNSKIILENSIILEEIKNLFIKKKAKNIIVYGEIFGGNFPKGLLQENIQYTPKKVQAGVFYTPDNNFLAFDIVINNEFISQEEVHSSKIPTVPILFRGNLQECLKYNTKFDSLIPEYYNYSEIKNNLCEGIVISPNKAIIRKNTRVIFKKKNQQFAEIKKPKKLRVPDKPEIKEMKEGILPFITLNRAKNVVSHLGELSEKEFGRLQKEMYRDIIEDFEINFPNKYNELVNFKKSDSKIISKFISQEISKILRENRPSLFTKISIA